MVVAMTIFSTGCPAPVDGPADMPNDNQQNESAEALVVRVEFETEALPDNAEAFVAELTTVEVHVNGGWIEVPIDRRVSIAAHENKLAARIVIDDDKIKAQSFRLSGQFALATPDSRVSLTPTRGVQVNMRNQKLVPGAVNHIKVSLADAFSKKGPHGWTLDPTLAATLEVDHANFTSIEATPESGGTLELDNGFEIVIPPGAVESPQLIHVERVDTGTWPYYLAGPEGTQFNTPITVKYPPMGEFEQAAISWDGEVVDGVIDDVERVVVQNDHFSCFDDPNNERVRELNEGVTIYTGDCCGNNYNVALVDLKHPRVMLRPLLAPEQMEEGWNECVGERVFTTTNVSALLGGARTSVPDHLAIAALNGDNYDNGDVLDWNPEHICFRDLTIVNNDPIHGKILHENNPERDRFAIEFDNYASGGTFAAVTQSNPLWLRHVFTAGSRTFWNGEDDSADLGADVHEPNSRASYGFSADGRYLVMAAADDEGGGMDLEAWLNIATHTRMLAGNPVVVDDLYRVDEGGTTEFAFYDEEDVLTTGAGSVESPDGTNLALGVFWRNTAPPSACANKEVPLYTDVTPKDWFFDEVTTLLCYDVIDNAPEYRPGDSTNRAEFLKVVLELAYPGVDFQSIDASEFDVYDDVKPVEEQWYLPYVKFADDKKIVEGFVEGDQLLFKPAKSISRSEASKMVVEVGKATGATARFAKIHDFFASFTEGDALKQFQDVLPEHWFYDAVMSLHAFDGDQDLIPDGIVCGQADGTYFMPKADLNRAEMGKLLCMAAGYCPSDPCP